jgi:O-acetylserine/cysteine efflux transporter
MLLLIGLTLFAGQFILLFLAIKHGLPPGVASVTQQLQVFFTVILAAIFLREIPTLRQGVGMSIALAGLTMITTTIGADLSRTGLALGLGSAMSWAVGNVLLKQYPNLPMLPLMVWLSLVPPLPALALSVISGDEVMIVPAILHASWPSLISVAYLGTVSTVAAYAVWGNLLSRYSAVQVAPYALLSPCAGTLGAWLAFGEVFPPIRYVGMGLILIGVVLAVLPLNWNAAIARQP